MSEGNDPTGGAAEPPRRHWIVPSDDEGADQPEVPLTRGRHSAPDAAAAGAQSAAEPASPSADPSGSAADPDGSELEPAQPAADPAASSVPAEPGPESVGSIPDPAESRPLPPTGPATARLHTTDLHGSDETGTDPADTRPAGTDPDQGGPAVAGPAGAAPIESGQAGPDQTGSDQAGSDQTGSDQAGSEQAGSDGSGPGQDPERPVIPDPGRVSSQQSDPDGTTVLPRVPDQPAWDGFTDDAFTPAGGAWSEVPEPEAAPAAEDPTSTEHSLTAAPGRAARRRAAAAAPARRDPIRTIARGIGQTLITFGVVLLLFVVYEVYITDIFSAQKQDAATARLDASWQENPSSAKPSSGATTASATEVVTVTDPNKLVTDPRSRKRDYETFPGDGFAKLYIPAFGPDYHYTIIEGISTVDLETGPGHYEDSQYPGEQGNFAIAGHRVSKGSPFNAMAQLSACDAIIVETKDDWFIYRMLPTEQDEANWSTTKHAHCTGVAPLTGQYAGVRGREITVPSDYAQVLPVPHVNSTDVPKDALRLITLTTCHPQFSDSERMIIHGVLVKSYAKSAGFLPPELKES